MFHFLTGCFCNIEKFIKLNLSRNKKNILIIFRTPASLPVTRNVMGYLLD